MGHGSGYTAAADMWSIGCITAALLSGDVIFIDRSHPGYINDPHTYILTLAAKCDLKVIETSELWKKVGQRPKDFLKKILVLDETQRMSAEAALLHPWFSNDSYKEELDAVYSHAIQSWVPSRRTYKLVEQISSARNHGIEKPSLLAASLPPAGTRSPNLSKTNGDYHEECENLDVVPESSWNCGAPASRCNSSTASKPPVNRPGEYLNEALQRSGDPNAKYDILQTESYNTPQAAKDDNSLVGGFHVSREIQWRDHQREIESGLTNQKI
jgi:serine/threonine protein kinase